eukprot:TRINITY_DN13109_c0_g1_i2.p1 TRINITY_DN13109_c0_g1~~TRINITY_DN13109_c0_g1_i2.p1  ORF type:complete len:551 (-),score=173.79 TRINITY_DN13109_c0_g1_i2:85-1737(-)
MEESWRSDLLEKLKRRNRTEVLPFQNLFEMQNKLLEHNINLKTENSSLNFITEKLKEENLHLKSKATSENISQNNENFLELQKKLFKVQEELTELHRRKGENAQQVIDLSAALKVSDKDLVDKQSKIDSLEAELISLTDDLKRTEIQMVELESTNQLLKDEYQALQLALNSAETKLRTIQKENEVLVTQLMELKAKDADRMNFENDQFLQKQQQQMQIELAEAAKEQKSVSPEKLVSAQLGLEQAVFAGVTIPTKAHIKFEAHDGEIMSARWDYAGRYFATAGADRKIKIWEISKGISCELKSTLTGSNAAVMGIDFDTSGTMILGSSNDFATRVWTIEDCRLRHTLTGHSGKVLSAKFLGDATRVVSGSHDRTLKVWDLRSKACICTKFAGSSCNDLVTSDQVIISGHFDKKVRLWDNRSSSSEPMSEMVVGGKVSSLDLSRDLNYLAVCSRDDKIQILDLRKGGGVVGTVGGEGFHVGCDWSRVSLSPSAEEVVGGGGEGGVHIWNIGSGVSEGVLRGHSSTVAAVSWHPGGGNIVSVDKSKTCIIWA